MCYKIILLKVLLVLTLVQIIIGASYQEYVIKNKYSGMVLDGESDFVEIKHWQDKKSQLWTLEGAQSLSYYYLHNVGNGKVLDASARTKSISTYSKHGGQTQRWAMNPGGESYLKPAYYPSLYMMQEGNFPILHGTKQYDGSDKWILVKKKDA